MKMERSIILDAISKCCFELNGVHEIHADKSLTDPFDINIKIEGEVDGVKMVQQFTLSTLPYVGKTDAEIFAGVCLDVAHYIMSAGLFTKKEGGELV